MITAGPGDAGGRAASAVRTYSPDVATVGDARRFVCEMLESWGIDDLAWTATLLVTELTTNAVLHASTPYTVGLEYRADGSLHIAVSDGSARKPRERGYAVDATTGRGLGLIGSLASAWGTSTVADGKTVWCDVRPDSRSALDGEPDLDAFLGADDIDLADPVSRNGGDVDARMSWMRAA